MKTIIRLIVLSFSLLVFGQIASAEMLLFVGEGCSHCENLEKYLETENLYQKFDIRKYEIFKNLENRSLFLEKTAVVGVTNATVPFLIDDQEYIAGASSIKAYLSGGDAIAAGAYISVLNKDDAGDLSRMTRETQDDRSLLKNTRTIISVTVMILLITLVYRMRSAKNRLRGGKRPPAPRP